MKIRDIARCVLTLPTFFGWLYVLLFVAVGLAHKMQFNKDGMLLTAEWTPWAMKHWKYSTTISRGIIFQVAVSERIVAHEQVHVRQAEDRCLLSLTVSFIVLLVTGNIALFLCLWLTGFMWQLPNFLGALLRGGDIYRDSEHERSAYSQTDVWHTHNRKSWLELNSKLMGDK